MKRTLLGLSFLALVGWCACSYQSGGIMDLLLRPDMESATRLSSIQQYFQNWGPAAPFVYMLIVMVEVILAPIPGTVLYLPGGVVFGGLVGGSMSLAGNVIGAGVACKLMRVFGGASIERYFERGALQKYEATLSEHGLWIVFLLRVNPLTSSDLVSYAAGLTRLPVWKVMAGTLLGMAPLCFVQAYFAQELFTRFPRLIYPLILIGIAYGIYVVRLLQKIAREGAAVPPALVPQKASDIEPPAAFG
jgi:uncharacterized membrane protein YdjX (TVP38/TMEM64 family)